jgi:hypothetical protein
MLLRLLATLTFLVAIAIVLVRQPVKRGNAWGGVFGGLLFIAAGIARAWGHSEAELAEILLLQLDPQNLHEYMSSLFVMLGYGLALGAMIAMPWLAAGTRERARRCKRALLELLARAGRALRQVAGDDRCNPAALVVDRRELSLTPLCERAALVHQIFHQLFFFSLCATWSGLAFSFRTFSVSAARSGIPSRR